VLKVYKVDPILTSFLAHIMKKWKTTSMKMLSTGRKRLEINEVRIKRGIFQGDTLSPLWFCLALNPLSRMLKNERDGYVLKNNDGSQE